MTFAHINAGHRAYAREFRPRSLAQAIAAHFAASDAFALAVARGSLVSDVTFRQLERQAETARAELIEALQREGATRAQAERMMG